MAPCLTGRSGPGWREHRGGNPVSTVQPAPSRSAARWPSRHCTAAYTSFQKLLERHKGSPCATGGGGSCSGSQDTAGLPHPKGPQAVYSRPRGGQTVPKASAGPVPATLAHAMTSTSSSQPKANLRTAQAAWTMVAIGTVFQRSSLRNGFA